MRRSLNSERGSSLLEYALLLALLVAIGIPAISALGTKSRGALITVSDAIGGSEDVTSCGGEGPQGPECQPPPPPG